MLNDAEIITDYEKFLQTFHSRYPGRTPAVLAPSVNDNQQSTYDLLLNEVPTDRLGYSVLDLACGDGYLLARLAERNQEGLRLSGIDMNDAELAEARSRLGPSADLRLGRAQRLPYADQSFDRVLCHMALMLMSSVESVLSEAHRVLKPRGKFAAIISAAHPRGATHLAFNEALEAAYRSEGVEFLKELGDVRLKNENEIQIIFTGIFKSPVTIEKQVLSAHETLDSAVYYYMSHYPPAVLSKQGYSELERTLKLRLKSLLNADGRLLISRAAYLIRAEKA